MEPAEVRKPENQPLRVKARSRVCYWAVRKLGMNRTGVSKLLGIGQPAVSRAVVRGGKISSGYEFKLNKVRNAFIHARPLIVLIVQRTLYAGFAQNTISAMV